MHALLKHVVVWRLKKTCAIFFLVFVISQCKLNEKEGGGGHEQEFGSGTLSS